MKTEEEIRHKLEVLRAELEQWQKTSSGTSDQVITWVKAERVNALEWVLGENEEW